MISRVSFSICLAASLAWGGTLSVSLVPGPARTVTDLANPAGWGYTINNLETNAWMELVSISNTATSLGTMSYLSSFPILAPTASLTENYVNAIAGLAEFLFDAGAAPGSEQMGTFLFQAVFYDANPSLGFATQLSMGEVEASFEALYQPTRANLIPEPSSASLCVAVIAIGCYWRRSLR